VAKTLMPAFGKPGFEIAAEALGIQDALFRPTRELDALYHRAPLGSKSFIFRGHASNP
jgi:hypothetical protein